VEEEMQAINELEAKTLSDPVELPEGAKAVQLKFIFTRKVEENGQIERYKARLVYNHLGDTIEEEDNYSPVANKVSLRVFLTAVASQGWYLCQADVKTAFLNADNPGRELVKLPKEVVEHEHQRVRVLLKALYGLQRAAKMWHQTFAAWAKSVGFDQSDHDQRLFMHSTKQQMSIVYVDDLLLAAENEQLLGEMCDILNGKFQSRVMGVPYYFLGMNIQYNQQEKLVLVTQQTYIGAIVQKYGFETLLPRSLPMVPGAVLECGDSGTMVLEGAEMYPNFSSLVGALLYLAVCTRPDISFSVGILSKFVSKPGKVHWDAAVNLLGYLKGTANMGILLGRLNDGQIYGYADSDWAADTQDRKSISGGIVFWGASVISWFSRKQQMISLSTAEAESHAMVDTSKEVIYVQRLAGEVGKFLKLEKVGVPIVYSDNQPALDAVLNGKGRTKHYDLRIKFLAFGVLEGLFLFKWVPSRDNVADVFTKALRAVQFKWLVGTVVTCKFCEA
jgi:hypothetical protein